MRRGRERAELPLCAAHSEKFFLVQFEHVLAPTAHIASVFGLTVEKSSSGVLREFWSRSCQTAHFLAFRSKIVHRASRVSFGHELAELPQFERKILPCVV